MALICRMIFLTTLLALASCSSTPPPSLPGLDSVAQTTLTPEEQAAKIKQLAAAQAAAGATVQQAVLTTPAPEQ
jgi:hypothetical protein